MRRVATRGWSLVPGGRWYAADQPGAPISSLPVLRGARRDRDPERAGRRGARHCPPAPESPVDCLARAASQRGDSERRSGVSGVGCAVAQRPTCQAPEDSHAGRKRSAAALRAGPPRRHGQG